MHILIVDDEEPIRELIKYNLEKEGFHTITANNAAQAVFKTRITRFNSIRFNVTRFKWS